MKQILSLTLSEEHNFSLEEMFLEKFIIDVTENSNVIYLNQSKENNEHGLSWCNYTGNGRRNSTKE